MTGWAGAWGRPVRLAIRSTRPGYPCRDKPAAPVPHPAAANTAPGHARYPVEPAEQAVDFTRSVLRRCVNHPRPDATSWADTMRPLGELMERRRSWPSPRRPSWLTLALGAPEPLRGRAGRHFHAEACGKPPRGLRNIANPSDANARITALERLRASRGLLVGRRRCARSGDLCAQTHVVGTAEPTPGIAYERAVAA